MKMILLLAIILCTSWSQTKNNEITKEEEEKILKMETKEITKRYEEKIKKELPIIIDETTKMVTISSSENTISTICKINTEKNENLKKLLSSEKEKNKIMSHLQIPANNQ